MYSIIIKQQKEKQKRIKDFVSTLNIKQITKHSTTAIWKCYVYNSSVNWERNCEQSFKWLTSVLKQRHTSMPHTRSLRISINFENIPIHVAQKVFAFVPRWRNDIAPSVVFSLVILIQHVSWKRCLIWRHIAFDWRLPILQLYFLAQGECRFAWRKYQYMTEFYFMYRALHIWQISWHISAIKEDR